MYVTTGALTELKMGPLLLRRDDDDDDDDGTCCCSTVSDTASASSSAGRSKAALVLVIVAWILQPAVAASDDSACTGKLSDRMSENLFEESCLQDLCGIDAINEFAPSLINGGVGIMSHYLCLIQIFVLFCVLKFSEVRDGPLALLCCSRVHVNE